MNIFLGPRLWNPEADGPAEIDEWPDLEDAETIDALAAQVPAPVTITCPACNGEACGACAGTGTVLASDDEAALVAFRRAAAAFLHPSGLVER